MGAFGEARLALEGNLPLAVPELDRARGGKPCGALLPTLGAVHQVPGLCRFVVYCKGQTFIWIGKHVGHQHVHPKWGVYPAEWRLALVGVAGRKISQIHQKPGLSPRLPLLHQANLAAYDDVARLPRALHSLLAHGVGIHVVAKRQLVARVEGLKNFDRAEKRVARFGLDREVRKPLLADGGFVLRQLLVGHQPGKPHTLNAGIKLINGEGIEVGLPAVTIHVSDYV